jgi:hypothetical protein
MLVAHRSRLNHHPISADEMPWFSSIRSLCCSKIYIKKAMPERHRFFDGINAKSAQSLPEKLAGLTQQIPKIDIPGTIAIHERVEHRIAARCGSLLARALLQQLQH